MDTSLTVPAPELRRLAERILIAAKVPVVKAELVAESLVAANLRGVDSHGVMLLPYYVAQLQAGNIDPQSDGRTISESGGCLLYDGQSGIGQHISSICCNHAVRLAGIYGIGIVIARNSNHFGAAAFWAKRLSAAGMIGIVMSNASPSVAPWQGREGRIGTNPLCMSIPSQKPGEWLLDMATTTVAKNRIVKAASIGQPTIPAGWAMDSEGIPTQDTEKALRGLLTPLGGYKGSGLGMMAEILGAVLSGGAMSTDVGGLHSTEHKMNTSHSFIGIEVSRFLPLQEFQSRMEYLIGKVKSTCPAHGYEEILVAGDPELRMESRRLREGIPIEANIWKRLTDLAQEKRQQ
jgi:LDH2 family malate/lactate/ureidoglycolate dehydrogenase